MSPVWGLLHLNRQVSGQQSDEYDLEFGEAPHESLLVERKDTSALLRTSMRIWFLGRKMLLPLSPHVYVPTSIGMDTDGVLSISMTREPVLGNQPPMVVPSSALLPPDLLEHMRAWLA